MKPNTLKNKKEPLLKPKNNFPKLQLEISLIAQFCDGMGDIRCELKIYELFHSGLLPSLYFTAW